MTKTKTDIKTIVSPKTSNNINKTVVQNGVSHIRQSNKGTSKGLGSLPKPKKK